MDIDNRADEAPRRRFVSGPTGFRRLTPGLLKVDRKAEGFTGLPVGVTTPGQLLAAFKAAAPRLGISPRLVHAIDWLFRFTQPQDWEKGGRPIVWPSALMQQDALGLSSTQVKEINRRFIELGLVTMKDCPNGKRYGMREPKGRHRRGLRLRSVAARRPPCRVRAAGGGGEGGAPGDGAAASAGDDRAARGSFRSSRRSTSTASRARSGVPSPRTRWL